MAGILGDGGGDNRASLCRWIIVSPNSTNDNFAASLSNGYTALGDRASARLNLTVCVDAARTKVHEPRRMWWCREATGDAQEGHLGFGYPKYPPSQRPRTRVTPSTPGWDAAACKNARAG